MNYGIKKITEWTGCYDEPLEAGRKNVEMLLDGLEADHCVVIGKQYRSKWCLTVECVDKLSLDDIEDQAVAGLEYGKITQKTDRVMSEIFKMQFKDYIL